MEFLITAVEQAVKDRNWYAALSLALTLPDICGKADGIEAAPAARYLKWAEVWFEPYYVSHKSNDVEPETLKRYLDLVACVNGRYDELKGVIAEMRAQTSIKYSVLLMTAKDLYALRCAYCHQMSDQVDEKQRVKGALERFQLTYPDGNSFHRFSADTYLQLQVDIFCQDICGSVRDWLAARGGEVDVKARLDSLARIHPPKDISWS